MKTRVVHLEREPHDVFIGRPSKWGNPYSHMRNTRAQFKVKTRREAIQKYREYILTRPDLLGSLHELRGKRLGCYCAPLECHGDVLAELADNPLIVPHNHKEP